MMICSNNLWKHLLLEIIRENNKLNKLSILSKIQIRQTACQSLKGEKRQDQINNEGEKR